MSGERPPWSAVLAILALCVIALFGAPEQRGHALAGLLGIVAAGLTAGAQRRPQGGPPVAGLAPGGAPGAPGAPALVATALLLAYVLTASPALAWHH